MYGACNHTTDTVYINKTVEVPITKTVYIQVPVEVEKIIHINRTIEAEKVRELR